MSRYPPFFRSSRKPKGSVEGPEAVRAAFAKFRRIQKLNTQVLELMAEIEQALGGEYIFDRAFLESSVRRLGAAVYQVVYSLNAMSGDDYIGLFDVFQNIKGILDDILEGGLGPFAARLTLPYSTLGWEMEPLVGILNVCLAEARQRLDIPAPDGFAVTKTGCRLFMQENRLFEQADREEKTVPKSGEVVLPPKLEAALLSELKELETRADPARLRVRACALGASWIPPDDAIVSVLVRPEDLVAACKQVLWEFGRHAGGGDAALAVSAALAADVTGSIAAIHPSDGSTGFFQVTASATARPAQTERFLLRRIYPYDPTASEVQAKSAVEALFSGVTPLSVSPMGLYHGSALIEPPCLQTLAEYAMTFERMLGRPCELHWIRKGREQPAIVDIRIAGALTETATSSAMAGVPPDVEILFSGGETAQTGVSAGKAVHIEENFDLNAFPHGAVAIARTASPRLSPVLRRASALLTECGTSFGHLATIARELRVPAIFGLTGVREKIIDGMEVTVDAGERLVYHGIVEPLLAAFRRNEAELYPSDPEYAALRRILRWVMPLHLIDPEAADFNTQNCKTYHDIIHFAHEKSVEELLRLQERGRGWADFRAHKLELDIPLDLFVLDIGRGLIEQAGPRINPGDIRSKPFLAFLDGLGSKAMWQPAPTAIRFRDIFSGLDRTFSAMTSSAAYGGGNHALIAENYMNVGLRLGYHFSVIDSYLGNNLNQNYIYFRFVGGFADERQRKRRADLIQVILEEMHFKVTVKDDLIVGKFKIAETDEMIAMLKQLGELTGFTRQLDMAMISEDSIEHFALLFRKKTMNGGSTSNHRSTPDA